MSIIKHLGIFGDSFSYPGHKFTWPKLFESKYKTEHHGMYGTSLWNAHKKFLLNYKKYTHIIFSYTHPNRLHCVPKHIEMFSFLLGLNYKPDIINNISATQLKDLKTIIDAHKLTFDDMFDIFVYQQIFNDVNEKCNQENIKLINIMPYEKSHNDELMINLEKRAGCCLLGLEYISLNEENYDRNKPDPRGCHLSIQNNNVLFNLLDILLKENNIELIDLKNGYKFQYENKK